MKQNSWPRHTKTNIFLQKKELGVCRWKRVKPNLLGVTTKKLNKRWACATIRGITFRPKRFLNDGAP